MIFCALVHGIPAAVGQLPVQPSKTGYCRNEGSCSCFSPSVGSDLCVVTSVSRDCPPFSGKNESQYFPTQDAGRVIT